MDPGFEGHLTAYCFTTKEVYESLVKHFTSMYYNPKLQRIIQ